MKSEDFIQLRLLLGTYVTAPSQSKLILKNIFHQCSTGDIDR